MVSTQAAQRKKNPLNLPFGYDYGGVTVPIGGPSAPRCLLLELAASIIINAASVAKSTALPSDLRCLESCEYDEQHTIRAT